MSNLLQELTRLKELQQNMNNSYEDYKTQKERLKQKERECKMAKETYLQELISYFKENPITIYEFVNGLENLLFEDNLVSEITTIINGVEWIEIKLKDVTQFDCTKYTIDKNNKLKWIFNDEPYKNLRKSYFLKLLNKIGAFIINIKILKDNKIIAQFTTQLDINNLDSKTFDILFTVSGARRIKINLKINEKENLHFVIPEKYLTTRTQIGGGIKPEMLIEMLENIINERLCTQ